MALTDAQLERYSRHIILKEVGVKGQKKLLDSKVLIIGAGGLGAPAAMYLAAEEFGHRRLSGVRAAMRACLQYGILVSAVSGAALFFLSDFFAMKWLRDLRAAPSLRVMGLLLPFSCLCGIMTGYYTACSRIRQLVGIEIAERLVSVGLTVALLYLWAGDDLARACCAITFGSSAGCIFDFTLLYLRYRRDMRQVPRERIPMRKRLLRLSVPLALNDALRAGLNTAEQLLIPINMRDGSLLCVGKGNEDWNCSAPHGAGRLMSRADAKQSFTVSEFKKQMAEVYTTSVSKATLDECPMAYKGMQDILDNIGPTADVVKVIRPIYNFKAGDEE